MTASLYPYLVIAGWTLLVVLWATTVIGVLLAAWLALRPRARARDQHAAAAAAFALAAVVALVAPIALTSIGLPAAVAPSAVATSAGRAAAELARTATFPAAVEPGAQTPAARISADAVAAAGAVIWLAGIALLTLRLAGGWLVARSIRTRAVPLVDAAAQAEAQRLQRQLGLSSVVTLLQSAEVEAPVVIGWRRPALILPVDVMARLQPRMMPALLAHEFAHIARRDYAINVLQSAVEILLFFSPAVLWISRYIRETREFCCDDAAVASCGDARHYVDALTTLASLGAVNTARPLLGAAGPRLITRVRRLLQVDALPRFVHARIVSLGVLLAALIVAGMPVTVASASRASRLKASPTRAVQPAATDRIPFGFTSEQEGSGVDFHVVASTREAPLARATIRNMTNAPVDAVQFVAAVERRGRHLGLMRPPVRLFVSGMVPVSVPAGQIVELSPPVVTGEQVQQVLDESPDGRVQLFFGLSAVRYANGFEWRITPNPAAVTGPDVFGSARPQVPRALFTRDDTRVEVPYGVCRDHRGRAYSHGAHVPVLGEPGNVARCADGRWVEDAGRR